MGAPGFCIVMQKEIDIRYQDTKLYHFQHQAFANKKSHNPIEHPCANQLKQTSKILLDGYFFA